MAPGFAPGWVCEGSEYCPAKVHWCVNPQGRRGADIIGFRNADGVFIGVEVKAGVMADDVERELRSAAR